MPDHENTRSQALRSYMRPLFTRDFLHYLGLGFTIHAWRLTVGRATMARIGR